VEPIPPRSAGAGLRRVAAFVPQLRNPRQAGYWMEVHNRFCPLPGRRCRGCIELLFRRGARGPQALCRLRAGDEMRPHAGAGGLGRAALSDWSPTQMHLKVRLGEIAA